MMCRAVSLGFLVLCLCSCGMGARRNGRQTEHLTLLDTTRNRLIPIAIHYPAGKNDEAPLQPHPVVLISGGYGISHEAYSFLVNDLSDSEYVVVNIQHDLPTDAPIATAGDIQALRTPVWERGAENIRFVRSALRTRYPHFGWGRLVLIGHSNGGDISVWFAKEEPSSVLALITLDHRRVALPRLLSPQVLTIRADDTEADPGVLPSIQEQERFAVKVERIEGARHNDMYDGGSEALKRSILEHIRPFLSGVVTAPQ